MPDPHPKDWRLTRKACHLPPEIIHRQIQHPLLNDLFLTAAGYIPAGLGHYIDRAGIDETVMIYCVEGRGWYRAAEQLWPMQAGDLLLAVSQTAHAYGADAADPWTIHWVHFNGQTVPAFLELLDVSVERPILAVGTRSHLIDLFNTILAVLKVDHGLPHLINAATYLRQVLSNLLLLQVSDAVQANESTTISDVIDFMHENITQTLRLDELALRANLSRSYFSRFFRRETGYAPIDYFIRLKIERACELLDSTEMKVSEISHFLGYQDPHYFSRLFKQITHQSPRAYRKERRIHRPRPRVIQPVGARFPSRG